MYKLVISDDEGATTVVPLVRDEITIGRKEGNTIRLTERNVSRNHARLIKRNGSYVIEDLGSYNGIKINGSRIDDDTELQSGDRVNIGDYQISFEAQNEVLTKSSAPPPAVHEGVPPARLVMVGEPAPGAEFSLNKERIRVGRDEHLDIWVDHGSISREHAEIQVADDRVTIFDLESANGMKVNGVDTSRASLQSGDVVELGEVSFRYLPAAATHSLDAAAAPEIASKRPVQKKKSSVAPLLFALVGAVALAYGAFSYLSAESGDPLASDPVAEADTTATAVASGDSAETQTEPSDPSTAEAVDPAAEVPPLQDQAPTSAQLEDDVMFAAALEACERAVEQGRWEDALRYASRAVALRTEAEGAAACRAAAQAGLSTQTQLDDARSALAANKVDQAWRLAAALPADSVLRKGGEFAEIRDAYVRRHLGAAGQSLRRGDNNEAARQARLVLQVPDATRRQKRDAQRLLTRASKKAPPARAAARKKPTSSAKPTPPKTAAKPKPAPRTGGIDAARQCLQRGDNRCAINALENGQARTASGLALLIETYRATGNTAAARRHMRTFVQRYPNHGRTSVYAQMLEAP